MLTMISRNHVFLLTITLGLTLKTVIADPRCPEGWVIHKDLCYTVYEHFHVNFQEAVKICQTQSGYVPSASSEDLQMFLNNWLLNATNVTTAWISGQKANYSYLENKKSGTLWFWHSDETVSYSKWHSGHPTSIASDNCMVLKNVYESSKNDHEKYIWQGYYDWSSESCAKLATAICAKKACPLEWTEFKGMCYKHFDGLKMNYKDAATYCQNKNANLTSISCPVENRFLTTLLSKCTSSFIWTSGKYRVEIKKVRRQSSVHGYYHHETYNEIEEKGPWIWGELNTNFGYTNWINGHGAGDKNTCMNLQNRLAMNNDTLLEEYKWAQHSCDEKNTFVCRKKP